MLSKHYPLHGDHENCLTTAHKAGCPELLAALHTSHHFPSGYLAGYKDLKPLLLPLMLEGLGGQRSQGSLDCLNLPLQGTQEHCILTMNRDPQVMRSVLTLVHLLSRILSMLKHGTASYCTCTQLVRQSKNQRFHNDMLPTET